MINEGVYIHDYRNYDFFLTVPVILAPKLARCEFPQNVPVIQTVIYCFGEKRRREVEGLEREGSLINFLLEIKRGSGA